MNDEEEVPQLSSKVGADVIVSNKLKDIEAESDKPKTFKIKIYDNNRIVISMHGYNPIKYTREFIGMPASDK